MSSKDLQKNLKDMKGLKLRGDQDSSKAVETQQATADMSNNDQSHATNLLAGDKQQQ